MKFESKIGIGEVVERNIYRNGKLVESRLLEVIQVIFASEGEPCYLCEEAGTGIRGFYTESMIEGDPDFDQEAGCYPEKPEQ